MRKPILLVLALLPVFTYVYWTLVYPVNVPFLDDFLDSVLISLVKLKTASSLPTWLKSITAFYNEHRLVYTRLIALLSTALNEGRVDFRFLLLIGNAALIGLLGLFWFSFRERQLPAVYFLPVPFLVLQTQAFENMLYGMASLQNFSVPLFAALALYALPQRGRLLWAIGAGVLASLTSGNGMFVFLAGIPVLFVQRRIQAGVFWLVAGLIVWAGYLSGYHQQKSISTGLFDKLTTFFGLLGGAVGAGRGTWIPVVVGVGLFSWLVALALPVVTRRRHASTIELFYLSLFAWVLLTACAIALNRSGGSSTSLSRYKVYPMLTLVIFYLLTLERLSSPRRVWLLRGTLLAAIPFWVMTQLRMPALLTAHRQILLTDAFNFRHSGSSINPTYLANGFQPYPYLKQARAAGVYEYPTCFYSSFELLLLQPLPPVRKPLELAVDSTSQPGLWTLHQPSVEVPGDSPDDGVYLVLQSSSNTYLLPTLTKRPLYGLREGPSQGFIATLAPKALRHGKYRIGLYTYHRGTHTLVSTTTRLLI